MKKCKTALSLMLGLGLMLGAVACGQKPADNSKSSSAPAASASATPSSDSAQSGKTATGELYKMHILGPEGSTGKFKFSERERYKIWPKFHELLKQYGLDPEFEIVSIEQYKSTIQTRMSSGQDLPEFANVAALGDATIFKMADQGFIQPINKLVSDLSDGTSKITTKTLQSKRGTQISFGVRIFR